jgi:hypothetical protein
VTGAPTFGVGVCGRAKRLPERTPGSGTFPKQEARTRRPSSYPLRSLRHPVPTDPAPGTDGAWASGRAGRDDQSPRATSCEVSRRNQE